QIEDETLHWLRALDRDLLAPDEAVAHCRQIVGRRPVLGAGFLPVIEIAGLEALEGHRLIPIIVESNLIVVPLASVDRQVLSPIVGDALIGDRAPRGDLLDAVRTRAKRRLERRLHRVALIAARVLLRPIMLRQDGELTHDHGQLAVVLHIEIEGDLVVAGCRSEEHTSELQSLTNLVCRLLLDKNKDTLPSA